MASTHSAQAGVPHSVTGMAYQRRLVFGVLTVISLVLIYILCKILEKPTPRFYSFTHTTSSAEYSALVSTQHPRTTQTAALKTPTSAAEHNVNITSVGETGTSPKGSVHQAVDRTTDPPFIGDTYTGEDVHPQTNCTDSIRSRFAKTEFAGRFQEQVPVLQWAKHVTPEQYERLKMYPGAHGWGGLDYKTLEDSLSVLTSAANMQLLDDRSRRSNKSKCIHCAVVGNGGILKDSKKGKEIDGHHYVFRSNGAIIPGFEEDVGSRTTHYTFSTNTLVNSMRSYAKFGFKGPPLSNETRFVFLPDHDRDYLLMKAAATHTPVERGPERGKDASKYFGETVSKEKLKMYHPDFIRYIRDRFLRSKILEGAHKDIYRPSTGAVMLLAALHTCDRVSAYGFMTPDFKNYSDHYYDSSYHPVVFYVNHDLRMEMTLWQKLHEAHLIQLYMRQ
ncbi:Alpha-N-acetylgalactosaminide alpha-2,6-sialyltransferase 2 [Channa argus]|uniref:alpha-N-acetylgalactosaminide alpha-2,6-sialyltransferase n=1 Tax=Channa argus TaxID=215402 RepID=A0A6G1QN93_CHAAH|nr:Alpha-N-acetylgalactosaminide alpha-2,6-sialyltransferase 2 [Channa argus]KAK2884421.1 hypothetical protein Q8A73_020895 [Channa argus]